MMSMLFLLLPAAGFDETPEEVYKRLALGDRVEITFRSGGKITGTLALPPRPADAPKVESVDYSKEKALTLDVGIEYPGLTGTMTVRKDQVRAIRKIEQLTAEERKRLEEERRKIEAARAAPKPPPAPAPEKKADEPKPGDPAEEEAKKLLERLQKGAELYKKFPPPDWGELRENAIKVKLARGQLPTLPEREFHEGYELWSLFQKTLEPKKAPEKKD